MAGETNNEVIEVKNAVIELRECVEKHGINSPEFKEMQEKMDKVFEKEEKYHQELTAKVAESEKKRMEQEQKAEELEERVKQFESNMAEYQSAKKVTDHKDTPEYKALQNYVKYGELNIEDEEHACLKSHNKTMRMDDDTQGGYLTTTEFDNMILKNITEISAIRSVARVRTISKKTLEIPKRTAIPVAAYEGEAETGTDDESTYGSESLTAYRLSVTVPFTMDLLMDSNFSLESEINADVVEAFSYKEGNKFVLGTGVKQPEGFLINATVAGDTRTSETADTITMDDMINLTGDLKTGYNPMYGFNRTTLAFLRTLKGDDNYFWQPSVASGVPNTLNGEPYIVIPDMPAYNVTDNLAVVYADFLRGYMITDRTGMVIIRDQYAKKRQAIIEITFHRWNHGQVILPEAFKLLKIR